MWNPTVSASLKGGGGHIKQIHTDMGELLQYQHENITARAVAANLFRLQIL